MADEIIKLSPTKVTTDDQLQKVYLLLHLYLLETNRILLSSAEFYSNVYLNEDEILDSIMEHQKTYELSRSDFDFAASYLHLHRYINLFMGDHEESISNFIQITEKGLIAIMSGEFWLLIDRRYEEIKNRELIESSIKSNNRQKRINFWLILATGLAAVMPFVVAWIFPSRIIVNYPPVYQPDIRIDTVWLRKQIERIQTRLPIEEPKTKN